MRYAGTRRGITSGCQPIPPPTSPQFPATKRLANSRDRNRRGPRSARQNQWSRQCRRCRTQCRHLHRRPSQSQSRPYRRRNPGRSHGRCLRRNQSQSRSPYRGPGRPQSRCREPRLEHPARCWSVSRCGPSVGSSSRGSGLLRAVTSPAPAGETFASGRTARWAAHDGGGGDRHGHHRRPAQPQCVGRCAGYFPDAAVFQRRRPCPRRGGGHRQGCGVPRHGPTRDAAVAV